MTENNSNRNQTNIPQIYKILELNQHIISLAALCYVVGFAITNLYLGSFGVVNFDILRVRYILTGLLFAFFIAIIVVPFYGLFHVLIRKTDSSVATTLAAVFFYTLDRYSVIFLSVLAIGVFASKRSNPSIELFDFSNKFNWLSWFANQIPQIFYQSIRFTLLLWVIVIIVIAILFSLILVINPKDKDGERKPRKAVLKEFIIAIKSKESWSSFLKVMLLTFLVFFTILAISDLISFMTGGNTAIKWKISAGWIRFVAVAFLFYLLISVIFLFLYLLPRRSNNSSNDEYFTKDDPLDRYYSWLYLIAFGILWIVPVYTLNIYPEIPQQIGGGAAVEVKVLSTEDLSPLLTGTDIRIYLLDRTAKGAIFLVVNTNLEQQTIVEVSESQIKSIIYDLPQVTPTNITTSTKSSAISAPIDITTHTPPVSATPTPSKP